MTTSWWDGCHFSSSTLPPDIDHSLDHLDSQHFHSLCLVTKLAAPDYKLFSRYKLLYFGLLTATVCICSRARIDGAVKCCCICWLVLCVLILPDKSCSDRRYPEKDKLPAFSGIPHCCLRSICLIEGMLYDFPASVICSFLKIQMTIYLGCFFTNMVSKKLSFVVSLTLHILFCIKSSLASEWRLLTQ